MLTIRMQRTGRKGHAMFRVVVQEARLTPTSGKVVALLGSYDPHAKVATLDKEKATFYLGHGAQPSDRVTRLLLSEGLKLPGWVKSSTKKEGALRNPAKLRKNQPKDAAPTTNTKTEDSESQTPESPQETAVEAPSGGVQPEQSEEKE